MALPLSTEKQADRFFSENPPGGGGERQVFPGSEHARKRREKERHRSSVWGPGEARGASLLGVRQAGALKERSEEDGEEEEEERKNRRKEE